MNILYLNKRKRYKVTLELTGRMWETLLSLCRQPPNEDIGVKVEDALFRQLVGEKYEPR